MTRSIALLGSTGSIGRQTLEVARELGLTVAALTANSSVDLIEQQAREFCPRLAVLYDEAAAAELRERLRDTKTQVLSGMEDEMAEAARDMDFERAASLRDQVVSLRAKLEGTDERDALKELRKTARQSSTYGNTRHNRAAKAARNKHAKH